MLQNKLINNRKLHVFIADDDSNDLDLFKSALKEIAPEIKITMAFNGKEVMELLQVIIPDIIFLDINIPYKSGIECLSEIRLRQKLKRTPVIMFSDTTNSVQIDKTYQLGATMFLEKTHSYEVTREKLKFILSFSGNELLPQLPREKFLIRG